MTEQTRDKARADFDEDFLELLLNLVEKYSHRDLSVPDFLWMAMVRLAYMTNESAPNEEEADNVVQFLCDTADRFAGKTEGELIQWWQYPETKKTADLLDQGYPEHYKQLMAHLSALRASLKESNDE